MVARLPRLIEHAAGLFNLLESSKRLSACLSRARLRRRRRHCLGALHLIGSLLKLPRRLFKFRIAAIARQTFEFAGNASRFLDHFLLLPLRLTTSTAATLHLAAHPLLNLLLLPSRQFLQSPRDLVLLLVLRRLLLTLQSLVLILHLVELKLEQIGQVLRILAAPHRRLARRPGPLEYRGRWLRL